MKVSCDFNIFIKTASVLDRHLVLSKTAIFENFNKLHVHKADRKNRHYL